MEATRSPYSKAVTALVAVIGYTVEPGSPSQEALVLLSAWTATEHAASTPVPDATGIDGRAR